MIVLILSAGMFIFINDESNSMAYAIMFLVTSAIVAHYMLILRNAVEKC